MKRPLALLLTMTLLFAFSGCSFINRTVETPANAALVMNEPPKSVQIDTHVSVRIGRTNYAGDISQTAYKGVTAASADIAGEKTAVYTAEENRQYFRYTQLKSGAWNKTAITKIEYEQSIPLYRTGITFAAADFKRGSGHSFEVTPARAAEVAEALFGDFIDYKPTDVALTVTFDGWAVSRLNFSFKVTVDGQKASGTADCVVTKPAAVIPLPVVK